MLNQHQRRGTAIAGIRKFARKVGFHEEAAIAVYEDELHRLEADAKVARYVDVIAEKRAKDKIREVGGRSQ